MVPRKRFRSWKHARYTGLRTCSARTPEHALAAAIVLQALKDWRHLVAKNAAPLWNPDASKDELREFFLSEWCQFLCDEAGIDYRALLQRTVG